MRQEWDLYRA